MAMDGCVDGGTVCLVAKRKPFAFALLMAEYGPDKILFTTKQPTFNSLAKRLLCIYTCAYHQHVVSRAKKKHAHTPPWKFHFTNII